MEGVAATVTPDKFAAVTDTNPEIRINSYTIDAEGALPAADLSTDARAIVFGLNEREISAVLSTDDGYAVALLDAIEPPHTPELEAIRPVVTATYVAAKAKDEAERIAAEIERAVNEGTTLAEAAAAHGVAVETTRPFSRNDLSKGTATGEGMIAEAFELADFEARTASTGKGVMVYTVTSRENVDMAAYATDAPTLAANLLQDKKARVYAAYVQNLRKEAETAGIIQIKKDL
jgi:parvulin-like peptidyl-prolyl isomerase